MKTLLFYTLLALPALGQRVPGWQYDPLSQNPVTIHETMSAYAAYKTVAQLLGVPFAARYDLTDTLTHMQIILDLDQVTGEQAFDTISQMTKMQWISLSCRPGPCVSLMPPMRQVLPAAPSTPPQGRFGITIQNLTSEQRQNLGISITQDGDVRDGGVQIYSVEPSSFAEDIGLAARDILLSINNLKVNTIDDMRRIQNTLKPGDAVAIRILRQNPQSREWNSEYLSGTLPNKAQ
jgi:PDZ domain